MVQLFGVGPVERAHPESSESAPHTRAVVRGPSTRRVRYWAPTVRPHREEEVLRMAPDPRDPGSDVDDAGSGSPNPRSGAGAQAPRPQAQRLQRGLSQAELALRAGLTPDYLFKVESARRGCNPEAAGELAAILEVDLRELRTQGDDAEAAGAGGPDPQAPQGRLPAGAPGLPEDHLG